LGSFSTYFGPFSLILVLIF